MHRFFGWVFTVSLTGGALQFLVTIIAAVGTNQNVQLLLYGLGVCSVVALISGIGWLATRPSKVASVPPGTLPSPMTVTSYDQAGGQTAGQITNGGEVRKR